MARLAIRATGDKSQRENVTTGESVVRIACTYKNESTHLIEYRHIEGVPTVKVWKLSQRELAAHSETRSE